MHLNLFPITASWHPLGCSSNIYLLKAIGHHKTKTASYQILAAVHTLTSPGCVTAVSRVYLANFSPTLLQKAWLIHWSLATNSNCGFDST